MTPVILNELALFPRGSLYPAEKLPLIQEIAKREGLHLTIYKEGQEYTNHFWDGMRTHHTDLIVPAGKVYVSLFGVQLGKLVDALKEEEKRVRPSQGLFKKEIVRKMKRVAKMLNIRLRILTSGKVYGSYGEIDFIVPEGWSYVSIPERVDLEQFWNKINQS